MQGRDPLQTASGVLAQVVLVERLGLVRPELLQLHLRELFYGSRFAG